MTKRSEEKNSRTVDGTLRMSGGNNNNKYKNNRLSIEFRLFAMKQKLELRLFSYLCVA